MKPGRNLLGLGFWIATGWAAGAVGNVLSRGSQPEYYKSLRQPSWSPPPQVFGPVWSALYTMMGAAAWLLWRNRHKSGARAAISLYAAQLALNASWSPIFFGLRKPRTAMYNLAILWTAVLGLTMKSWKVDKRATFLLLPYLAWTTFAGLLNKKIVDLNPAEEAATPRRTMADSVENLVHPQTT